MVELGIQMSLSFIVKLSREEAGSSTENNFAINVICDLC